MNRSKRRVANLPDVDVSGGSRTREGGREKEPERKEFAIQFALSCSKEEEIKVFYQCCAEADTLSRRSVNRHKCVAAALQGWIIDYGPLLRSDSICLKYVSTYSRKGLSSERGACVRCVMCVHERLVHLNILPESV